MEYLAGFITGFIVCLFGLYVVDASDEEGEE